MGPLYKKNKKNKGREQSVSEAEKRAKPSEGEKNVWFSCRFAQKVPRRMESVAKLFKEEKRNTLDWSGKKIS